MNRESSLSHRPSLIVTNVDSPLGHSIVRNINSLPFRKELHVCGTMRGKEPFGGESLCDTLMHVRTNGTPSDFLQSCESQNIGLIIPTTELEAVTLKESQEILPFVLASSPEVSRIFLDKALTAHAFERAGVAFCPTVLPSDYARVKDLIGTDVVVKPRRGEHSQGVIVNPPSIEGFPDDHFVVQPLMTGTELTTAVYFLANGAVHGSISFIRRFVPQGSVYEVTPDFDSQIISMAKQLRGELAIVGSINIQSIVVDGKPVPFEVNGRISSSNVIRSELGFPDVQWGIEEYLLHREPSAPRVTNGSAVTSRVDIIYHDKALADIGLEDTGKVR